MGMKKAPKPNDFKALFGGEGEIRTLSSLRSAQERISHVRICKCTGVLEESASTPRSSRIKKQPQK